MAKPTSHILLDTNQCLHWKRADQIDWEGITGGAPCVLYIAPVVLRELEEQKIYNKSEKLRHRASALVRWLAALADRPDPIVLRRGVELVFIEHEPTTIDFAAMRLSERIADDLLIATALDLAGTRGERVSIASDDSGLKVKLRSRPTLAFLQLPDADKLPAEPDQDQEELRQLRTELARLQARRPKLVVVHPTGESHISVKLTRAFEEVPSLDEIKRQHPLLQADITEAKPVIAGLAGIPFDRNAAFNERLTRYYDEYGRYEAGLHQFRNFMKRAFDVSFRLRNVGKAPANQIDVIITFPPHVRLLRRERIPKAPSAPNPPARDSLAFARRPTFEPPRVFPLIDMHQDGTPSLNEDRNTVEYSLSTLKHEFDYALEPVVAVFAEGTPPNSFEATFLAACNETDSEGGALRFVIE